MKKLLLLPLIAIVSLVLPACDTVEESHEPVTHSTTTTETSSIHTAPASSSTTTVRSY